jgi:hypothetical protein
MFFALQKVPNKKGVCYNMIMKKFAVVIVVAILTLFLGGCFSSNNSKVLNYKFESIQKIQMFCADYSSGVTLTGQDAKNFYNKAKSLNFVLKSSYTANQIFVYEYYFVITKKDLFFEQREVFVLNQKIFYNQHYRQTLGTDGAFVAYIEQTFERLWQQKISEV